MNLKGLIFPVAEKSLSDWLVEVDRVAKPGWG